MIVDREKREELVKYRGEFEYELHQILDYWMKFAPDEESGGFHGAVDMKNNPVKGAPKSCVLTSRILWTFSEAAIAYPEKGYGRMAERAYGVLRESFKDQEFQGYFMELNEAHQPSDSVKHTYAQAFVLYSLSKYYEYSKDESVLGELKEFFLFLDLKARDNDAVGYIEGFSRDWNPIQQNRMADDNDPRSMNTHLHLLEAYAAVYKVWFDKRVKERLTEILILFRDSIIRKDGHLGIFFDYNFKETEVSESICSFGHDIEASWLILEALEILGDESLRDQMSQSLIKMSMAVFREGMDQDGGLFLESTRSGSHVRTNKHWWLQAEMLVGEMNAYEVTGDWTYIEYLKKSWSFINQYVIDHKSGEWYTKVNRLGVPFLIEPEDDPSPYYRNDWKIDPWKCPYHNGRAMLELIKRIDNILKR